MTITSRPGCIVTGGRGLGREYALELGRRGAKVVVNDLGGARDGTGASDAAQKVVEEIEAAGGQAMANGHSVTEFDQMQAMVAAAKEKWGGVHVLINNAGVLRDKTFIKRSRRTSNSCTFPLTAAPSPKAVWEPCASRPMPYPDDREQHRAVRQFRPGQLRRANLASRA